MTAATPRELRHADTVGAIRLAAAASADCRTFRKVVDTLCSYAPETRGETSESYQETLALLGSYKVDA